jgi:hypothetical protein
MAPVLRLFPACAAAVVLALVLSAPAQALAAASARLVYVRGPGAEQCAGQSAVRAAVSARLGYDPFFPWAPDTLFAQITRDHGAFHAEIKLVDEQDRQRGARTITVSGDDCAAVIDAMALTISLTIDPSSLLGPPAAPAPPPPPAVEPPPAPAPAAATNAPVSVPPPLVAPARPKPAPAVTAHLGLGAIGSLGAAPAATVGVTVLGGIAWRSLSLDLEGRADLPASAGNASSPVALRSSLLLASLVPCVHVGPLFGCGVASGGQLSATSEATVPRDGRAAWAGAGARVGVEWTLWSSLAVRGYVEGLATLTRHSLALDGAPVYTFAPWSGDLALALVWHFS